MADILRISVQGTMPGGEVWSVNPCFWLNDFSVPVTFAQVQAVAQALAPLAIASDLRTLNVAGVLVTGYRVEARTFAGALEQVAESASTAPSFGQGAAKLPYQSSVVLSLRSDTPGAKGRGRLYWPATAVSLLDTNLRISTPSKENIALAAKTYLSGMETAVKATFDTAVLAVWSRVDLAARPVTKILVGDLLDVQRRRRDALAETYASETF